MKKNELIRKLLGGIIAAFGIYWVWSCLFPPLRDLFFSDDILMDVSFLLTIVPLMALPGILAVVFGLRLFNEYTTTTLKWLIGVFYGYLAFHLSARLDYYLDDSALHTVMSNTAMIGFTILAVVLYVFSTRFLAKKISGEIIPYPFLLSRGIFLLIAWMIWLHLSDGIRELAPVKEGYEYVNEAPWDTVAVILPILVAYISYRFSTSKLMKAQQAAGENASRPTP
jgi:hypothetical protein